MELTYTSSALEGNSLTRNETAIVLEKGITVSGKPLKDHLEATGHREAPVYVRDLAQESQPIRKIDIRNIHRLVLQKIDPEEAGRYSNHHRGIIAAFALAGRNSLAHARLCTLARNGSLDSGNGLRCSRGTCDHSSLQRR